jgi:large subunit ribosomal protein L3
MGRKNGPRHGSMQVWPRKRSKKIIPSVNWRPIIENSSKISNLSTPSQKSNILGFICYKTGMASAFLKDNTPDSMTKGKRIIFPVTILECPNLKIFSIRFYKTKENENKRVIKEILSDNLDKELKRICKLPKNKINTKEELEKIKEEDFDDVTVIAYSEPKEAHLKKTPNIIEIGLSGNKKEKLEFIKNNFNKALRITDFFQKGLIDAHGVTKGKGFQGPVKRFGIDLRSHKAEKGQRKPGSIGPWHPIGVSFRVARAGGMGNFSRIIYNLQIITSKKAEDSALVKDRVFEGYGKINTDYIIIRGSIQGSPKTPILITNASRPTKKQLKKNYEIIELR